MATDSTVGVDSAADTLVLSGPISGNASLTKAGDGTLEFLGAQSSFTGTLVVLAGTLQVPIVNNAGTDGPFGASLLPIVLGSAGKTAQFLYTSPSFTTNRGFTLAADGTGEFDVESATSLILSGAIGGNGNLNKTGSGTLTLTAADNYTGTTTVSSGNLTISGSDGSLASTSITVTVAGNFTIYNANGANRSDRIAADAILNLAGGTLGFNNDGSSGNNFSQTLARLNLVGGNSTISTGWAVSSGTRY